MLLYLVAFYFAASLFVGNLLFILEYGGQPIGNFKFSWPITFLKILYYKLKNDLNPCFECLVVPIILFYAAAILIILYILK